MCVVAFVNARDVGGWLTNVLDVINRYRVLDRIVNTSESRSIWKLTFLAWIRVADYGRFVQLRDNR